MGVLRGCFIGVDRYADPSIAELSSAKRDAVALHALFSDNLAGSVDLLCDEAATSAAVTTALTELQRSDADDVVVISFSGHGTSTHELVTHDADVNDLAASCISLDALTELIAAVPARQLICILDCCFSGGAGAKVLNSPRRPRSRRCAPSPPNSRSCPGRVVSSSRHPQLTSRHGKTPGSVMACSPTRSSRHFKGQRP
jgi:helicase